MRSIRLLVNNSNGFLLQFKYFVDWWTVSHTSRQYIRWQWISEKYNIFKVSYDNIFFTWLSANIPLLILVHIYDICLLPIEILIKYVYNTKKSRDISFCQFQLDQYLCCLFLWRYLLCVHFEPAWDQIAKILFWWCLRPIYSHWATHIPFPALN